MSSMSLSYLKLHHTDSRSDPSKTALGSGMHAQRHRVE